ncbi:hypothetical protein RYX36_035071, partial [Vicia faba]
MGFFSFNNSSRYVGIWYHNVPVSAYVWVANRGKPIKNRQGSITIKKDGNLVVLDGENNGVWSSNISVSIQNSQAVLRNDGNLVLLDTETNKEFEPKDMISWKNGNWSKGCQRMNPLKGERTSTNTNSSGGEDGFLVQRGLKLPDFAHLINVVDSRDCERNCLQNSSCTAYVNAIGIGCMVWFGELVDVQRLENCGNTLNIRLADSDLDDAKRKTMIWIILAVVMGLICLGFFAWLLWKFKGKLKVSSTSSPNRNIGNVTVSEPSKSTNLLLPAEFS